MSGYSIVANDDGASPLMIDLLQPLELVFFQDHEFSNPAWTNRDRFPWRLSPRRQFWFSALRSSGVPPERRGLQRAEKRERRWLSIGEVPNHLPAGDQAWARSTIVIATASKDLISASFHERELPHT